MAEEAAMVPTFFTVDAVEGGDPLGMESGSIPDENITASSCLDGVTPAMGRLNVGSSWCTGDDKDCFLQVDCGKLHLVCAVATHGNRAPDSNGDYVKKYQIKHSNDGVNWIIYEEPMEQEALETSEGQGSVSEQSGADDDAKRLYEAMKGWGTDEDVLSEILCTRDNAELAAIREIYAERYSTSLEEALTGELSGNLRTLLVGLAKGERDESAEIDTDLAERDAKDLMAAGVQAWGTDEDVFVRIFTQRSLLQLSATFSTYREIGNEEITASLESEMSGHLLTALLTIVNRVQADPVKFYADQIHEALKEGAWTTVSRIIFSRSKIQLEKICTSYMATYGSELADDLNMMYHGDNKMALVERIDRTKVLMQRIFDGNTDSHNVKRNDFNQPVITRFIRFCPLEWNVWPCMSVELYGAAVIEQAAPPPDDEIVSAEKIEEVESTPVPEPEPEEGQGDGEEGALPHVSEDEKRKEAEERLKLILDEEKAMEDDIVVVDRRKQIEEDHRKRMEEIENRIKEQEDKRRQELEEKRRAEEEERKEREEERRKREEEAARKREEERRQLEEERKQWEDERKKREEEVRQMIEEGRRKREEERKKREEDHRKKREEERNRREAERKARLEEEKRKLEEGRKKREEEFRRRMEDSRKINIDVAVGYQDDRKRKEDLWNKKVNDPVLVEEEMKQVRDEERKRLAEERRKKEEEEAERKEREREISGEWRAKMDDTRPGHLDERRIIEYRLKAMEDEKKRREDELKRKQEEQERKKKKEEEDRLKALEELAKKTDEQREIFRKQREEEERKRWEEQEARKEEEERRRRWVIEERGRRVEEERKKREEEAELWRREMEKQQILEEEERKKKEEEERLKSELVEKKRLEEIEQKGLEAERRRKREEEQKRKDEDERRKREERERWRKKAYEKRLSGEMVRRKSEEDLREREQREENWSKEMAKRHSKNFENKMVFITGSPQKSPDTEEVVVSENISVVEALPVDDDDRETTVSTKRTVTVRTITTTVTEGRHTHFRPINDTNGEVQNDVMDNEVILRDHDHDHNHDHDHGHARDWYRRSCCDHLMPLDPAVQDAVESSFFSQLDDDKSHLRPLSCYGRLDLGSALNLHTPSNPIDDVEIDKILDFEQESSNGWKRVKKTRELEILRKDGSGPAITKAVITLPGIPYRDAVNLITDWSIRNKWDNTFDSVNILDEMADSKVLNCTQKNKRNLVLATLEREEAREPCHVMAWQKTVYPGAVTNPKMSVLRLDTMTCGAVIRPYFGENFSKVTIITQLRGNVPGPLRNTYLTGNPGKWMTQLKKYHTKQYVEVKPAKPKEIGGKEEIPTGDDNVNVIS